MKAVVARLAAVALVLAAFAAVPSFAQTATATFSGILTVIWGDPKPGTRGTGATRFNLTEPNGTVHPLEFTPAQRGEAMQFFGKRVTVHGRAAASAAPNGKTPIVVDDITSAEPANGAPVQPRAKVRRKVLFVLLKFAGDTQMPHPVSFYTDELTNPQNPPAGSKALATINGFFNRTSWGQLQWDGDVAGKEGLNPTHWITLPHDKRFYANCSWSGDCANLDQIQADALAHLPLSVNWRAYDNINFVLNNDLDCCAWGGSFVSNSKVFGATWEPPWSQEASTYVHELGHSIGLPHSGWRYYAYDSHHDEMSRGNPARTGTCGSYKSANDHMAKESIICTEPGTGYIVAHKDFLGWIPAANKATFNSVGSKTFVIEANALGLGNRLKMVKICLPNRPCNGGDGSNAHFLTLAARIKASRYEKGLPSEGVVIHDVLMNRSPIGGHCFFNNQSGWAVPIDATPGDFNTATCKPQDVAGSGLMDMAFAVGKTYRNAPFGITVKVVRKTATTYTVRVTRTK
jgi:hypothetical protein